MMQKTFSTRIKALGDRSFQFIISTGTVDRDNDTVNPRGWDLENYLRNPIVAWSHDYSKPPIARCTSIGVQGGSLVAVAEFPPPGLYELADTVHDLLASGFLHATSVGFKPTEQEYDAARGGMNITRQELLEFSIVSIPSNPDALIAARGLCNTAAITKWFNHRKESSMLCKGTKYHPCPKDGDEVEDECPLSDLCPMNNGKPLPGGESINDGVDSPKSFTSCPRLQAYGQICPNDGSLPCPAIDDESAPCPMYMNAGPKKGILIDTTMINAMKRGLKQAVRDCVREVTTDIIEKSTPGTEKFLIQGLQSREDSKKKQDSMAALLKWERWERMKLHLLRGEKVELEFRQELEGYLGANDQTWPKGEEILSLYSKVGL